MRGQHAPTSQEMGKNPESVTCTPNPKPQTSLRRARALGDVGVQLDGDDGRQEAAQRVPRRIKLPLRASRRAAQRAAHRLRRLRASARQIRQAAWAAGVADTSTG